MIPTKKSVRKLKVELPNQFTVQICSKEGRLLSEYYLTKKKDNVKCLAAAERQSVSSLSDNYDEQLVIVVSEETVSSLKQVQLRVVPTLVV